MPFIWLKKKINLRGRVANIPYTEVIRRTIRSFGVIDVSPNIIEVLAATVVLLLGVGGGKRALGEMV